MLEWNDRQQPGYWSDWRGLPQWEEWSPITDDGDRYRLARTLGLTVHFGLKYVVYFLQGVPKVIGWPHDEPDEARAITRAAAEIGRGMP